jgi:glutamate--cysteine ligase
MGTLFPEVRLKRYLEMRGADAGPASMLVALPTFWVGLLYDEAALDQAWQLVKGWTEAERQALRDDVPAKGLGAMIGGRSVHDIVRDLLKLARDGLARRARLDPFGCDETRFLEPLDELIFGPLCAPELRLARGGTLRSCGPEVDKWRFLCNRIPIFEHLTLPAGLDRRRGCHPLDLHVTVS